MAMSGCEHCGFISDDREPALSGPCPDCDRPLKPMTLVAAEDLLGERLAAERYRWRAGVRRRGGRRTGPSG